MRSAFCGALVEQAPNPGFVFLTGDLGYAALEPLRGALGPRFINAGVAEQNMVSVAAGLAATGLRPWVYSIAPFLYARALEQIRNDVCLHDLPVTLVGNGGGYGYGVMGGTHHALEDYGILMSLANMRAFVPAFDSDVAVIIKKLMDQKNPAYLRLGQCELPKGFELPAYGAWRRLLRGGGPAMLIVGPLAGGILQALLSRAEAERPDLWVLTELPILPGAVPEEFIASLRRSGHLFVAEEHVCRGGVGQELAHLLLTMGLMPPRFTHRRAQGYLSGLYGSQKFHRRECGLDPESILEGLKS